ncbi:uncharacterized mitochondrial protein AtMg00810-like [Benincasa hispida]|uniref:uncharacterized mitochondrial protein AtMg00810-like n=1 Tax=Benincasa hispida TaxID=102211 RepID=UPI0019004501|nr:uncharacterized mitochondrial protein AtMg00810-like [Benincasa hispida]
MSIRNLEIQLGQIAGELKNRPQGTLPSSTELPNNAGGTGKEQCLAVSLLSDKMTAEVGEEPIATNLNAVTIEDPLTYNSKKPEKMNPEVASTIKLSEHETEEVQWIKTFGTFNMLGSVQEITAYSDANWASNIDDQKYVAAYCVFLGNILVSWSSKKKTVVARSSTESEYCAFTHATAEITLLR